MKISISTKLILMTITILLATTALIAVKSSEFFQKVSSQREDYNNMESAIAKAKEVDNILSALIDRSKNLANEFYTSSLQNNPELAASFEKAFFKDSTIHSIELYKISGTSVDFFNRKINQSLHNEETKNSALSSNYFQSLRSWQKFPLLTVAQGTIEIKNASYPKAPPMITIGIPLVKDPITGRISYIALIDLAMSSFQKPFSDNSERTQFLVDRSGELLSHNDEQKAIARHNYISHPIVEKSMTIKTPQFQTKFTDPESNAVYFGAAVKTGYGPVVISQISQEIILEPAREVQRQAFYYTGVAISIAFFVVFLVSMSLTSPIETLADLIKLVAKGNFDVRARQKVKSHDEVGDLAVAFDQMTDGLKERDKVKNLFNKFHGSSVTDDLLQNDIAIGGQSKEVVVFFSDIRGFTAFSENRTAEEVVAMLNEYFAVMVKIINQHGGVVDKFIGDAIMAVWGAPKSSNKDAHNAVRACLDMRVALEKLNEKRTQRQQPPIQIGMGLHAGDAISGTIGSDERMEYTVIGNTVNTASRIEASTKAFGADLLITEEVVQKAGGNFIVELAGAAEVKGRSEAIRMYKVRGYKENDREVIIKTPWSDYTAEHAEKVKIAS